MNWQKYIQSLGKLPIVLAPSLVMLSAFPAQLLAESSPIQISLKFGKAEDRGAPERTIGGGRRGSSCVKLDPGKPSLTALMPNKNNTGNTAKDTTSLFVPKNTAKTAEFVLLNEDGDEIYKQELQMPGTSGIMKVSVPENVSLKAAQNYEWYFTITCDANDWSRNEYVKGSIKRVNLNESAKSFLKKIDPLEKAKFYSENGFWYNTLETLADIDILVPSKAEKP
jgi:hypothetical protein